jgi:transposase
VQRLDRHRQGNRRARAVMTVPPPEQEQARTWTRHREQLLKDRQTHEARGRSFLLYYRRRVQGRWWAGGAWEALQKILPARQVPLLENLRALSLLADPQLQKVEAAMLAQATSPAKGFGALTCQLLQRGVLDWKRFQNRRQMASLTGRCPSVHASGGHCAQGAISKHGNPRIRRLLVEPAWRVIRFQPRYPPVKKWQKALDNKGARGGRKKAAAAIDLWRMETGRTTAAKHHLL